MYSPHHVVSFKDSNTQKRRPTVIEGARQCFKYIAGTRSIISSLCRHPSIHLYPGDFFIYIFLLFFSLSLLPFQSCYDSRCPILPDRSGKDRSPPWCACSLRWVTCCLNEYSSGSLMPSDEARDFRSRFTCLILLDIAGVVESG